MSAIAAEEFTSATEHTENYPDCSNEEVSASDKEVAANLVEDKGFRERVFQAVLAERGHADIGLLAAGAQPNDINCRQFRAAIKMLVDKSLLVVNQEDSWDGSAIDVYALNFKV